MAKHKSKAKQIIDARLAGLIRQRLEDLAWDKNRLRKELSDARLYEATDAVNQIRTIEQWLSGNRVPREAVLEFLARQDPADDGFLRASRNLRDIDGAAEGIFHSLAFARPLADPPDLSKVRPRTAAGAWQEAINLLNKASSRPRIPKQRTVVIDVPGFETTLDEGHSTRVTQEWHDALWRALQTGHRVVHVLSWTDQSGSLPAAVQAELVLNLLYAATVKGSYVPVIGSSRHSHRIVGVQRIGAVAIWHASSTPGSGFVLQNLDPKATEKLISNSLRALEDDIERSRQRVPSIELHEGSDPFNALRFDMDLAAAESANNLIRCMIKSGPPVALVPPDVAERHAEIWLNSEPDNSDFILLHAEARQRRAEAFNLAMSGGTSVYRDIVTGQGIQNYLGLDGRQVSRGGARWGMRYLTRDLRVAHVRHLADLVTEHEGYELAVVNEKELLIPISEMWWAVTRGSSADSRAVFFLLSGGDGDSEGMRQGKLVDTGSTNFVDELISVTNLLWELMPETSRNPHDVALRLRDLADKAERLPSEPST